MLGDRIREARTLKDISAEELGDKLSVKRQTVYRYENGERQVSPETLYKISRVLGIPVGYFFDEEAKEVEPPPPSPQSAIQALSAYVATTELLAPENAKLKAQLVEQQAKLDTAKAENKSLREQLAELKASADGDVRVSKELFDRSGRKAKKKSG